MFHRKWGAAVAPFFNPVAFIQLIVLIFQTSFFIFLLTRGFDFSDEAYGYIAYQNPEITRNSATYFPLVFNFFFGWMNISIIHIRIVRLILMIVSSVTLGLGLASWLSRTYGISKSAKTNIILLVVSGGFLINANGSQSFTYNLLSSDLMQIIAGIFLFHFQSALPTWGRKIAGPFALGFLVFALFLIKFSNAVAILAAIAILNLIDTKKPKILTTQAISLIGGTIAAAMLILRTRLFSFFEEYFRALSVYGGQATKAILARYLDDVNYIKTSLIQENFSFFITLFALLLLSYFISNKYSRVVVAIVVTAVITYLSYFKVFYFGGVQHFYRMTLLYVFIVLAFLSKNIITLPFDIAKKRIDLIVVLILTFLLTLPLAGSFGTNNLLTIQIIWYMPFVFAGLAIMLYQAGYPIFYALTIFLTVNAAIAGTSGLYLFPYRTAPLTQESYQMRNTREEVRVREDLKASYESVYEIVSRKTKFSDGDAIFSLPPEFGFIYLLKGKPIGWSWYNEKATPINLLALKNCSLEKNEAILILAQQIPLDTTYQQAFRQLGIPFPESFEKIGDVAYVFEGAPRPISIYSSKTLLK